MCQIILLSFVWCCRKCYVGIRSFRFSVWIHIWFLMPYSENITIFITKTSVYNCPFHCDNTRKTRVCLFNCRACNCFANLWSVNMGCVNHRHSHFRNIDAGVTWGFFPPKPPPPPEIIPYGKRSPEGIPYGKPSSGRNPIAELPQGRNNTIW